MGEKRRRRAAGTTARRSVGEQQARELALHARVLAGRQDFDAALDALGQALTAAPQLETLWAQFGELIRIFRLRAPFPDALRALLERALEHPSVDPGDLVLPIVSAALSRADGDPLAEPLLLRLMKDTVVRDAQIESAMLAARQRARDGVAVPLPVLVAIAHQCFNTEYVMDAAEPPASPQTPRDYALYATFKPLNTLPDAHSLMQRLAGTPVAPLVQQQVAERLEEERLRPGIGSIGAPGSTVSQAVREQYEANPYPRWVRMRARFEAAPLGDSVREMFPGVNAHGGPARILLAGCGTGRNAIATALRFAQSSVLAVDLSRASLAYALRKTRELGLQNIEYRHADLLALGALDERFDLVEASGVLHHLADPMAGWRVLAERVKPGGFMLIGLYSERGRRHFTHARRWLDGRFEATPAGIREARKAIRAAASQDELLARVARNEDFFSLSGCRDMLFHVQEQTYELPQIARMLAELGLDFLGFEFDDAGIAAARYCARFPSDPRMRDLANWHKYEEDNPGTFTRMYQFWLQRR
jgi:SAM-dependent methyltransferase